MRRLKFNKFVLLFLAVAILSSTIITDNSLASSSSYFTSTDYEKLKKIHMASVSNDAIDDMIDDITTEDKAIAPSDINGARSLNPFIYYRYGYKVVYGTPVDVPNNEFANSSDGTMVNWDTGQRGEYKYLGYNYDGVEVTNDKFIRPTAGDWLSTPNDYKNIVWTEIEPVRDTQTSWILR